MIVIPTLSLQITQDTPLSLIGSIGIACLDLAWILHRLVCKNIVTALNTFFENPEELQKLGNLLTLSRRWIITIFGHAQKRQRATYPNSNSDRPVSLKATTRHGVNLFTFRETGYESKAGVFPSKNFLKFPKKKYGYQCNISS